MIRMLNFVNHTAPRRLSLIAVLLLCVSCGTSSPFEPVVGPFSGEFIVAGESVGVLSFTTQGNLIGGTGSIEILGETHPVSISANRVDKSVTGTVRNVQLGTGNLSGSFQDLNSISGAFNYTDNAQTVLLEGQWSAEAALP